MNQQQNGPDNAAMLLFLFVVFAGSWLVWHFQRQIFIYPVYYLRLGEVDLIRYTLLLWGKLMVILGFHAPSTAYFDNLRTTIQSAIAEPKNVTFDDFKFLNIEVGKWARYPFMAMMAGMAYFIFRSSKTLHYKTTYSMNSIKKEEVVNYPQISPVLNVNLVKKDLEKGPWAMAKAPLMFCQENDLVSPKPVLDYHVWGLNKSAAYRVITMQLGAQMPPLDRLPIHLKALVTIFVARATSKRPLSNRFINQLASSAVSGTANYEGVEEAFQSIKGERLISWSLQRHAYVYTFMATLLEAGRSDGVLASSEFLWVKLVDRRLWYVLNTVGRQTAFVEVAGPFSHWLAEKKLMRALKTPMIKEAVTALELAVEDILYVDEGLSWRSKEG